MLIKAIYWMDKYLKVTAVNEYGIWRKILIGDTLRMSQFDLFADIVNYCKFIMPIKLDLLGYKGLKLLLKER